MAMRIHRVRRQANHTVQRWLHTEHVRRRITLPSHPVKVGPYVTISRETGAGGSEIAQLVGKRLGWDVLDREIVEHLESEYGSREHLVELVDERHLTWLEDMISAWTPGGMNADAYFHRLHRLILVAAAHGNVVIVGRGARFMLPPERGLSVRILAPLEFRTEQLLLQHGISATEARTKALETDRQREAFVKEHFRQQASDPHQYDLVISLEKIGQQAAANLIVAACTAWQHGDAAYCNASESGPRRNS